jgi:7-cyano-7-deazaguanine synthase
MFKTYKISKIQQTENRIKVIKKKAILLLSGGLDSTTALYWALKEGYDIELLYIDFNHPAREKELSCVSGLSDNLNLKMHILRNPLSPKTLAKIGYLFPYDDHAESELLKHTIFILSFGVETAYKAKRNSIILGITSNNTKSYEGLQKQFFEEYKNLVKIWFKVEIDICNPFLDLSKGEVIKIGSVLNVPYELTWSCLSKNINKHCGACVGCLERKKAFHEAGIKDPTIYEI